jgi:hypothetical protein
VWDLQNLWFLFGVNLDFSFGRAEGESGISVAGSGSIDVGSWNAERMFADLGV